MDDLVERLTYAKLRELRERVAGMPCYDSDGDPAGLFDHHVFVRREPVGRLRRGREDQQGGCVNDD